MDENRRKFLKIIFIGSGALLMEKVLGPLFSRFLDSSYFKLIMKHDNGKNRLQ